MVRSVDGVVSHFRTLKALDDPNYVQWQVKLTTGLNQV